MDLMSSIDLNANKFCREKCEIRRETIWMPKLAINLPLFWCCIPVIRVIGINSYEIQGKLNLPRKILLHCLITSQAYNKNYYLSELHQLVSCVPHSVMSLKSWVSSLTTKHKIGKVRNFNNILPSWIGNNQNPKNQVQ